MGSASRLAVAALEAVLPKTGASEILGLSELLKDNLKLAAALTDAGMPLEARGQLAARVTKDVSGDTAGLLRKAIEYKWSEPCELAQGLSELGLRVAANQDPGLAAHLLDIAELVDESHELQLALGSKLGKTAAKRQLLRTVLGSRVSPLALEVGMHLLGTMTRRRFDRELRRAAMIAADQQGETLASVTVAKKPTDETRQRITDVLTAKLGRRVALRFIVDESLLGGARIELADEIIDASVSTRLARLRQTLAA